MNQIFKKKFSTISIIRLLFAALILTGLGFFAYKTYAGKTNSVKTIKTTIHKDWSTYTSNDYGFSFQYPKNYEIIDEIKLGEVQKKIVDEITIGNKSTTPHLRDKGCTEKYWWHITTQQLPFASYGKAEGWSDISDTKIAEILIDGFPAYQITGTYNEKVVNDVPGGQAAITIINHGAYYVVFEICRSGERGNPPAEQEEYNQILKTLDFAERPGTGQKLQEKTVHRLTYSFTYPNSWQKLTSDSRATEYGEKEKHHVIITSPDWGTKTEGETITRTGHDLDLYVYDAATAAAKDYFYASAERSGTTNVAGYTWDKLKLDPKPEDKRYTTVYGLATKVGNDIIVITFSSGSTNTEPSPHQKIIESLRITSRM